MTGSNPWDALPTLPEGDLDEDRLFAAVGRALTQWEMFEGALGQIFNELCEAPGEGPFRAYGAVAAFTGRADMLQEAFEVARKRDHKQVSDLPALLKRARLLAARRNEIAHGIVTNRSGGGKNLGSYLCPAQYNSRKNLSAKDWEDAWDGVGTLPWRARYAYTAAQLDHYRQLFFGLDERARTICGALMFYDLDEDA